jgi:hypothetical protein
MPQINTPPSCQTVSGGYIEPCNPDPADIHIGDMAHCLSLANRWAGNTQYIEDSPPFAGSSDCPPHPGASKGDPFFYSVAQHSCLVHDIVVRRFGFTPSYYALMHDNSEAYLMDVPRPIKPELTNYYQIEARLMAVIIEKYRVPLDDDIKKMVMEIDNAMIFWERDAIVGKPIAPYGIEHLHPGGTIYDEVPNFCSWSPKRAKAEFLMRFEYQQRLPILCSANTLDDHALHFVNDNLGFTSKWGGLQHLDFPKVC